MQFPLENKYSRASPLLTQAFLTEKWDVVLEQLRSHRHERGTITAEDRQDAHFAARSHNEHVCARQRHRHTPHHNITRLVSLRPPRGSKLDKKSYCGCKYALKFKTTVDVHPLCTLSKQKYIIRSIRGLHPAEASTFSSFAYLRAQDAHDTP